MILFGYLENKMGHLQMDQNPLFIDVYSISFRRLSSGDSVLFQPLGAQKTHTKYFCACSKLA